MTYEVYGLRSYVHVFVIFDILAVGTGLGNRRDG